MGGSPTSCLNFAEKAERDRLTRLESFSTVHGSSGWRWSSTRAWPVWGSFNAPNQLAFPSLAAPIQARTAWIKRISDNRVMTCIGYLAHPFEKMDRLPLHMRSF